MNAVVRTLSDGNVKRKITHAHTVEFRVALIRRAVRVVVPFNQSKRNINLMSFFSHYDERFSVVLLTMRFTFAFSTHNQWHLGAFNAFLIPQVFVKRFSRRHDTDSFQRSIFFLRFSCVCVCSAVDGDSSGTHMHWMRTRHRPSDNSLNYIIVIYSVRTSSAILTVSWRFFQIIFFFSFSFSKPKT